ncbi:transcription elongation factor GreA [Candidatus Parcubacteria bacterium]|nr:transcription elongation factor GreA [Candidatus Parcubacteria bacterium]
MGDQIISQEGYDKLKKELEHLTKTRRREIAKRIASAKELGDLSENAEYAEAKDEQAFNEGRVAEVTALLKNLTIVENGNNKGTVGMGSKVTVKINENERQYTIVSFNEADPSTGKISNESPLGMAFIDKKVGDIVRVETPGGEAEYKILNIE